jgi:hypothetical protein
MKRAIICLLLLPFIILAEEPVVSCTELEFGAGFFSVFQRFIAALDDYEKGEVSGLEIDLGTTGLYYDAAKGPNWWGYYFEPLPIHVDSSSPKLDIKEKLDEYTMRGISEIPTDRCHYLANKYLKVRQEFLQEANDFIKKNSKDTYLVGVQYRGTDKMVVEATYISEEMAALRIKEELSQMKIPENFKIFVATDDQFFLDAMKKEFGNRVCYFEMERSRHKELPIHLYGRSSGYIRGKEALLDCLVLSKSDFLFRTSSNLSNSALIFNPSLPSFLLNNGVFGDR